METQDHSQNVPLARYDLYLVAVSLESVYIPDIYVEILVVQLLWSCSTSIKGLLERPKWFQSRGKSIANADEKTCQQHDLAPLPEDVQVEVRV